MYALWSLIYDSILDKIFSFDRKQVFDVLNATKEDKTIEIGVGTGLNIPYHRGDVTGIDISKQMLAKAVKKYSRARLIKADASTIPLDDSTFDNAVATYVLRVTPNAQEVLEELSRIVRPEGRLVVADQFSETHSRQLNWITALLGWGKTKSLHDMIKQTPWEVISFTSGSTDIVLLENKKSQSL